MNVLIVEDEAKLGALLQRGLEEEGHYVEVATTTQAAGQRMADGPAPAAPPTATAGAAAGPSAEHRAWDVVILDWMLPDGDGLTLLGRWRRHGIATPVVMLTARGEVGERITGLRTGADDYLVKPFDFEELLARLEAVSRRAAVQHEQVRAGPLLVELRNRRLALGGRTVSLSGREIALAAALARRADDVITRAELLSEVWGPQFDGPPNVVDVYIGYLRSKLRELEANDVAISTVRGLGYRLDVPT